MTALSGAIGARPMASRAGTAIAGMTAILMTPGRSVKRMSAIPPSAPAREFMDTAHAAVALSSPISSKTVGPHVVKKNASIELAT